MFIDPIKNEQSYHSRAKTTIFMTLKTRTMDTIGLKCVTLWKLEMKVKYHANEFVFIPLNSVSSVVKQYCHIINKTCGQSPLLMNCIRLKIPILLSLYQERVILKGGMGLLQENCQSFYLYICKKTKRDTHYTLFYLNSDFDCSTKTDGLYPDPADCHSFYECYSGQQMHLQCGPDLSFNSDTGHCESSDHVKCNDTLKQGKDYSAPKSDVGKIRHVRASIRREWPSNLTAMDGII